MQEALQSSVDSLRRLLLIAVLMIAAAVFMLYAWSHPRNRFYEPLVSAEKFSDKFKICNSG
jgi:hypothetical protein